jgi:hypothetical protein
MTISPAPVAPDRSGAMVLIGRTAYTRVAAVQRLSRMFGVDEVRADELASNTYTWHLPHLASCTGSAHDRGDHSACNRNCAATL